MKAYILIKIRTGEIPDAISQLRSANGVVTADMTFGPYDAIALVESRDLNTLGQAVAREIQPVAGVVETLTCPVIEGV
jgi:DNA-binding Lrp family transcriptional regulator